MKDVLIICLALLTFSLQAQPGNDEGKHHRNGKNMDYTPEQIAELRTKKMALQLDLTEQQEKRVYSLMLNKTIKRKEKKEEHKEGVSFEKRKEILDHRIEEKKELKSILTKEQFDKWETNMQNKNRNKSRSKKHK
ncbi:MAG: protein CpxP [Flavobacteriaceae bacterium]|jgi:Spy/CpxP family protein refolding chaperone|uniref:hypothetical protein n=1 Tax=Candidatus Marifrigoribacter sp. Uisw_064 TaxID=3230970 RepID=UPI003AEBF427